jgi:hypothetical protein
VRGSRRHRGIRRHPQRHESPPLLGPRDLGDHEAPGGASPHRQHQIQSDGRRQSGRHGNPRSYERPSSGAPAGSAPSALDRRPHQEDFLRPRRDSGVDSVARTERRRQRRLRQRHLRQNVRPHREEDQQRDIQTSRAPTKFDRSPGHLRLRELQPQQLRTVLHQFCQRELAAVLRAAHLQARTRGVQQRRHQLAAHRVRRQSRLSGFDRDQTAKHNGADRRREQVPQGHGPDDVGQTAQDPREPPELPQTEIRHQHQLRPQPLRRSRVLRHSRLPGEEPRHVQRRPPPADRHLQQQILAADLRRRYWHGVGDAEAHPDALHPVQEESGLSDAHPVQLPTLLHPVHQAQRTQETDDV